MPLSPTYLDGQFLIAMPTIEDGSFARAVVYLCAHSADGAMGLIINKPAPEISLKDLLVQLDVVPDGDEIRLPRSAQAMMVLQGGPVETGRGFVLHSSDYHLENSTLPINEDISLTATLEVLKAIAEGRGPEHALLALGYAGWAPGQLEAEIQTNGWLTADAPMEVIFEVAPDLRYARALAVLGLEPGHLSHSFGRA
ncbi:YqgE/AlgH family protein [Methylobrevis albus]|uniref:UPF0301 protein I5731_10090 n=1 Tax=Methylobrevis albus TaxID=2793297 RepID=A0A931I0N7_9HYPH|nr:YqgE/AlgH family protein [Methylobrevis albus]MBH0238172.1 YqgE/AlgH family protein [Methylobrevis albus]